MPEISSDGKTPPPFRMNQFGGSIGGPVDLPHYSGKDKTFFFFNYEGQRQRLGATTLNVVPTAAERQGNLSAIPTQILRSALRVTRRPG